MTIKERTRRKRRVTSSVGKVTQINAPGVNDRIVTHELPITGTDPPGAAHYVVAYLAPEPNTRLTVAVVAAAVAATATVLHALGFLIWALR